MFFAFGCAMDLDEYAKAVIQAERFPLAEVIVCILIATVCIAALMVLAWFLFKTKLPRLRDVRRPIER